MGLGDILAIDSIESRDATRDRMLGVGEAVFMAGRAVA
jgi:hypothetical protein